MPPNFDLPFVLSVLGAFLTSSVVAYTYVWPAVRAMPRYDALRLLAAFHAFRFLGMNFLVSGFVSSGRNENRKSRPLRRRHLYTSALCATAARQPHSCLHDPIEGQ